VGSCVLALALAIGCGGAVAHNGDEPSAGSSQGGTSSGKAGASFGGGESHAGKPSVGGSDSVPPDGGITDPDPVDSGCPVQDLPPPELECDPYTFGSCGADAGCYPFVDHPRGNGCDQQRYGTVCLPAGQGTQGALCGETDRDYCAPGFVCVVGQRAGKRCAALCKLGAVDQCTGGFICGELDVAGFGVCG
jgi:hypothetical protein